MSEKQLNQTVRIAHALKLKLRLFEAKQMARELALPHVLEKLEAAERSFPGWVQKAGGRTS